MIAVHDIVSDPAAMTITVGPITYDRPRLERMAERVTSHKAEICGGQDAFQTMKEMYQHYTHLLGPKFNRRFQAANYWLWVGNRMTDKTGNMLRREGRLWKQYDNDLVYRANLALPYVNEAERDQLFHLIPLIVAFGASPQNIKRRVGQGAWRRAAANSLSRNCRIMNALDRMRPGKVLEDAFVTLLDFPSGVLRGVCGEENEPIAARITHKKTAADFQATVHLVRDTRRMMGAGFNPDWSLTRMVIEHNRAVRESHRRQYSDKAFASAWSVERNGFTATLLTSELDIATEGATQHHCVGIYARQAAHGQYAVLALDGKERATAGLRATKQGWHVDQVYAACNAAVSPECLTFVRFAADQFSRVEQERAA